MSFLGPQSEKAKSSSAVKAHDVMCLNNYEDNGSKRCTIFAAVS